MFQSRYPSALVSLVLVTFSAATMLAQAPTGSRSIERPDWGDTDRVLYDVGFMEFSPAQSSFTYSDFANSQNGGRFGTVPDTRLHASLRLPSGVLLTYLELDYCDTTNVGDVNLLLVECGFLLDDCAGLSNISSASGPMGCNFLWNDLTGFNYTTNNNLRRLFLRAYLDAGDESNILVGAYVGYKLQVSPAPGSATFGDVPTGHPFFRFVEALARSGITAGCGGGNFCPDQPLTRGQMAVFLAKALGLHFPS